MTSGTQVPHDPLSPYVPRWLRTRAPLPPGYVEHLPAALLYADLAGFTSLAETLASLPDGAERLDRILAAIFTPLVDAVLSHHGDVVRFAGDSLTAVFSSPPAAIAAGEAMQQGMPPHVQTPTGSFPLGLRVGIGAGQLTWQIVGTLAHGLYWLVSGPALLAAIAAERSARPGQVVAQPDFPPTAPQMDRPTGEALQQAGPPAALHPYLPPPLVERLQAGLGAFVSEYRRLCPAFVALPEGADLQDTVATALPIVAQFDGRLNEVEIGDKGSLLVLLFGAPVAHEDDPLLATSCLRALQEAGVLARAGLTLGTLFVGQVGAPARHTYTAVGVEMNLAARLMQAAAPGEILVSRRVHRVTRHRFAFRERGAVHVKGRDLPVPVAVFLKAQTAPSPPVVSEVTLQGRRAELERAQQAIAQACAGLGSTLRITGEAGIGKTRLAHEIAYLAQEAGLSTLRGAARVDRRAAAYFAWREPLNALLETLAPPQTDPAETIRALNPDWAERAPLLGDLLGQPIPDTPTAAAFDPRLRHESTQSLAVDLFRWKARAGPLCLLLDDLHWADALSLELVPLLARATQDLPLLLLLVHRPFGEQWPDTLAGLPQHTVLDLSELDEPAAAALVRGRAGDLPEEIASHIVTKGRGNPLFLEALVSIYRETGTLDVPETVQGVVQAHVDRLTEAERVTLKVASVLGRSFLFDDLRGIHPLPLDEGTMHEHLGRLTHFDLTLLEYVDPLSYTFKHIVVQEVAYASLLYAQRRELHTAAGRWYEDRRPADFPLLAYHWGQTDLETPFNRDRARLYHRRAGEQLAARFANVEAVTCLSRALDLTPRDDRSTRFELLAAREELYHLLGQREAQASDLKTMEDLTSVVEDPSWAAQVYHRQARLHLALGEYEAAITAARAGLEATKGSEERVDVGTRVACLNNWGQALQSRGDYTAAREPILQALALAQAEGDKGGEASSLRGLGNIAWYVGDYTAARTYFEQALAIQQTISDRVGEARSLGNLGVVSWALGDYRAARGYFEQGLSIEQAIGNRPGEARSLGNLGVLVCEMGDYAVAQAYLEQSLETQRATGDRRGEAIDLFNLGLAAHVLGDHEAAWAYREQALGLFRAMGDRQGEGESLATLGLIACDLRDYATAQFQLEQALEIFQTLGDRRGEGHALHGLGRIHLALGDHDGAEASFTNARDVRRETGQAPLVIDSVAGLAMVALARGDTTAALGYVEECLTHVAEQGVEGISEPLTVYQTAYQVLREAGRSERAQAILAEAHTLLMERAEKITDPSSRRSFLENVPTNREILAAWEEEKERTP